MRIVKWVVGAGLVFGTVFLAFASSHREAPLISSDPLADNTDVYAFVSPDAPQTVTLIANWIPLEAPGGGPNFYKFGDDVLYRINIDNDGDAKDDIVYEFRFKTHTQNTSTFLYNTGPIASLDDPNFNVRQSYSVTRIDRHGRHVLGRSPLQARVPRSVESGCRATRRRRAIRSLSHARRIAAFPSRPDRAGQRLIRTGVPAGASRKRLRIWALRRRMQPWEAARPIVHGSFVPCSPIGPRWSQLWRTFECAEIPSAATPNTPVGL